MKISNIKEKGNVLTFSISDSDAKFANLLRRYIVSNVPVLAIDSVVVYENGSSFIDEYISHRLGMVPISTPNTVPKDFEYVLVLEEVGPKMVYSSSLKGKDEDIKSAVEDIPIITLSEEQRIRVEAKVKEGYGYKHAKFQPGIASYSIDEKSGEISFKLESFYQFSPKTLLTKALKQIDKDVSLVEKEISKL